MFKWIKRVIDSFRAPIVGSTEALCVIALDADCVATRTIVERGNVEENAKVYLMELERERREQRKQMYVDWVANARLVNKSLQRAA